MQRKRAKYKIHKLGTIGRENRRELRLLRDREDSLMLDPEAKILRIRN